MRFWFHSRLIKRLEDEVQYLRSQLQTERERNDRLVEAIGQKADMPILMPHTIPATLEPAKGWWDTRNNVRAGTKEKTS